MQGIGHLFQTQSKDEASLRLHYTAVIAAQLTHGGQIGKSHCSPVSITSSEFSETSFLLPCPIPACSRNVSFIEAEEVLIES